MAPAVKRGVVDGRRRAVPWTGIGRYVTALFEWLPRTMGPDSPRFVGGGSLRISEGDGLLQVDLSSRRSKVLWEQVALPKWLLQQQPAFVHLPWYEGPLIVPAPLIVTVHDLDTYTHSERYSVHFRAYYNTLLGHYIRRAARVIAVSETTANDIALVFKKTSPVVVVYQGVDTVFHNPDRALGEALLMKYGCMGRHVVISASGVGVRKNIDGLARALRLAASQAKGITLVVTQTECVPPQLQSVLDLGVPVVVAGRLSTRELAALYSVSDVSVSPSLNEGFGLSVVEAMAAGCPVIASAAGSHVEISGGAAMLFDPRRHDQLAEILVTVLRDSDLRDRLTAAGRERAGHFSWERTASLTASVYQDVAD